MFAFLHSVPVLHRTQRVRAIDASEVVDNPLTVRYRTRRPGGPSGIFAFRRNLKLCKECFCAFAFLQGVARLHRDNNLGHACNDHRVYRLPLETRLPRKPDK